MSPYRTRLKAPEEIELEHKQAEFARYQGELLLREKAFSNLRAEIRVFEQVYEEILGSRIHELEELEWQLNGLLGVTDDSRNPHGHFREEESQSHKFHHTTDLLDDDTLPENPQKSLKSLYRDVAKAVHPDLAPDDEERLRRQELMAFANQAYESGDRSTLEDILSEWELGPDASTSNDIAHELVRIIRLIARVRENILYVSRQIEELKQTDIYCFKIRVDESMADGIDLLAEMAASVDLDISRTRKRLAVLRGENDSPDDSGGIASETRIIRFPAGYSCGTLYCRPAASVDYRDWQSMGAARGIREVFLDKSVRLDVRGTTETEMRFLDELQPDALQALFMYDIDDSALAHLSRLTGLQELYLSNTLVTDAGLSLLLPVRGLQRISIYHTAITDEGLLLLSRMVRLKWLTCSETSITESGLEHFRQALPGCRAVNFKWRYGV